MNRAEAEKLLGGYATGTLSEAERQLLFAAALEDQGLFNALADEEALRELLEDPAAREQLLRALAPKVIPFWRRPAILSAAAGLLVAVGGSLVVYRSGVTAPPLQRAEEAKPQTPAERQEAPKAAPRTEATASTPAPPPPPSPGSRAAIRGPAAAMPSAPPPSEEVSDKLAKTDSKDAIGRSRVDGAKAKESLKEMDAPPAANLARAPQAPAPAKPEQPNLGAQADAVHGVAAGVMGGAPAGAAGGVTGGLRDASRERHTKKAEASASGAATPNRLMHQDAEGPRPTWTLEGYLLRVRWSGQGQLYLLRRSESQVVLIPGTSKVVAEPGAVDTVFKIDPSLSGFLDLYQMPDPVEHPESLPAEGPIPGFRARVWPPKK